jgi:hypothetical protein
VFQVQSVAKAFRADGSQIIAEEVVLQTQSRPKLQRLQHPGDLLLLSCDLMSCFFLYLDIMYRLSTCPFPSCDGCIPKKYSISHPNQICPTTAATNPQSSFTDTQPP